MTGDDAYNLATHLQMIQGIVNRLAQDSFYLKGWSITLITGLFAFAARDRDRRIALLAILPAVAFWLLDAYYLWQERMFRDLYRAACEGKIASPYSMALTEKVTSQSYFNALFSTTELGFHGLLLSLVLILILTLRSRH